MASGELLKISESVEKGSNTLSPTGTKQVCVVHINLYLISLMGDIV